MEATSIIIIKALKKKGFTAYWAGGCVRDFLLGKQPKDYDIVTNAVPEEIERILSHTIPIGKQFGVILAVKNGHHFEIATFRKDSETSDGRRPHSISFSNAEEDAKRRDFTINAIFYDPLTKKILDYVGGSDDLSAKIIRFVGDPHSRIIEDHLRILRAIRFKNTLHFNYHPDTYSAIKKHSHLAGKVAHERLRDEIDKIMTSNSAVLAFEDMLDTGILSEILPELELMKGVPQPDKYHKEGDVWTHTMLCLNSLPSNASLIIRYAVLFHDVGKPQTFKIENKKITFYSHVEIGSEIAKNIMKRLKFTRKNIEQILWLIKHHMMFKDILDMRPSRRRHWFINPMFKQLMEVFKADIKGSMPLDNDFLRKIEKLYQTDIKKIPKEPKHLLNGEDIMKIKNIPPGKKVGEILEKLREKQLENRIKTKKAALKWLEKIQ